MLKKDTEGGLLRLMHLVKRTGVEKSTEKADQAGIENAQALETDEALRAANPDDDAGEKGIENPQAAPAEDEAIMHEASLEGLKGLSARTANELFRLKRENALIGEPEDYVNDVNFLNLLQELPPSAAVRVFAAEKSLKEAQQALGTAKEEGARDLMEKLSARHALPAPMKNFAPSAPETDFSAMTSEQFRAVKNRLSRAAQEKRNEK
ncbi:MAG TPA: hypothetical protein VN608_00275 [Clostridia bacterium]|nr:hypothetical protein [Clostridia bacterium]